eukprot:CAMPEP_0204550044 /NCGR_PEP_ID=MMETSP0661-20131031/24825_1 /ASSEMBLY_ACC=CAM_ASM_000606 /TAXON_ID=109239 /ORGANISM="Alexandrium margalefi, Strain AMGDE01CS-322" /LENGTH=111 /DNA_ID=CAMNT_0051556997 /DNA_START=168 /DNA_END=501 /DNA_ORIENTATION=-
MRQVAFMPITLEKKTFALLTFMSPGYTTCQVESCPPKPGLPSFCHRWERREEETHGSAPVAPNIPPPPESSAFLCTLLGDLEELVLVLLFFEGREDLPREPADPPRPSAWP